MRLTINKTTWRKLATQLNRKENAELKAKLAAQKITYAGGNPAADAILWDPTPELCQAIATLLTHERGFIRNHTSRGYVEMTQDITRLEAAARPSA